MEVTIVAVVLTKESTSTEWSGGGRHEKTTEM